MSYTGPILENWLLSGKAIFKNLSVGGAGLVKILVPEGKTYIVTKIELLPFANIYTEDELYSLNSTFYTPSEQNIYEILKRIQFQLLFYNPRINSVYNVRNEFAINCVKGNAVDITTPTVYFTKQHFDCFHIIEENSWLYLKYFDFDNEPTTISTDNYNAIFDGSQNWPPTPFYGYVNQNDINQISGGVGLQGFNYGPQGVYNFANAVEEFITPSIDNPPIYQTNFLTPIPNQSSEVINADFMQSIPFYNIHLIEINRRLSTTGLL
jgi:hypothetical protein